MNVYEEMLSHFNVNLQDSDVAGKVAEIIGKSGENNTSEVLKFLYSCIDLTSLGTEDSKESIWKFVEKVNDFDASRADIRNVAAVCVYPNFVPVVKEALRADVKIASVAGGFPSSQTFIEVKIAEVSLAVQEGADEIDIVFNCGDFFDRNLQDVCEEMVELKAACRSARLKVILETGLLKTASNIKKAAILSLCSGADFVKSSTGKVYPGATPEAVYVMCDAVKEYDRMYNRKAGIKVSGGVRTAQDAVRYYTLVKETLGNEWLTPELFRIGASSLADNILNEIKE